MEDKRYGKLDRDTIKKAVNYIFRDAPIEKAKKGEGPYLDVVDTIITLSFKIVTNRTSERQVSLYTGLGGLLSLYENSQGSMEFYPVRYNGEFLNADQNTAFWKQVNKKAYGEETD